MEEKNQSGIVPDQHTGKIIDTESFVDCDSTEEARAFFEVVKERLLNVNSWSKLAGAATADFQVVDQEGREVNRPVRKGDYFKIDIPGPGSESGEGYDWVRVEEIKTVSEGDMDSVGIRVRPTANPQDTGEDVAHFYSEESTSNFTVTREGKRITAGIYDRNTKPNKEGDWVDKVRHWLVGLSAVVGFSKFQWHQLTEGLVSR
jgi:hypothetical protein